MSHISTHILDTTTGKPAESVTVILFRQEHDAWKEIARNITNKDGRIPGLTGTGNPVMAGIYKLKFMTGEYFAQSSRSSFYPFIEIIFETTSLEHYHIPLLLNPFGYTTYRGS